MGCHFAVILAAILILGLASTATAWPHQFTVVGEIAEKCDFDGVFLLAGLTLNGAPYYKSDTYNRWVYYDADCSGSGSDAARWIFDDTAPSTTSSSDLDQDGACSYLARVNSEDSSAPPSNAAWTSDCDGGELASHYIVLKQGDTTTTLPANGATITSTTTEAGPGAEFIRMDGACNWKNALDGLVYQKMGYTARGAPFYRGWGVDLWLYWDPNCGSVSDARWILDSQAPSTTADSNLDAESECEVDAYIASDSQDAAPSGEWRMYCGGTAPESVNIVFTEVDGPDGSQATTTGLETSTTFEPREVPVTFSAFGSCADSYQLEGQFTLQGETANGPYYKSDLYDLWLYYDHNCGGSSQLGGWFFDTDAPSLSATEDVDGDGDCNYYAYYGTYGKLDSIAPPIAGQWKMQCQGEYGWRNVILADDPKETLLPPTLISLTGGCLEGLKFQRLGQTANGAPYYQALDASYWLYWDADCSGGSHTENAGWFLDIYTKSPSLPVMSTLDDDRGCSYTGMTETEDLNRVPSGSWKLSCDGQFSDVNVTVEDISTSTTTTTAAMPSVPSGQAGSITVFEACPTKWWVGGTYKYQGQTAVGPYYKSTIADSWLYYDPSCSASGLDGRWIFDVTAPSLIASSDLDSDLDCVDSADSRDGDALSPPFASESWWMNCGGTWSYRTMYLLQADPAPELMRFVGGCPNRAQLNGLIYTKKGHLLDGSPWYKAWNKNLWIFWDPHCDGDNSTSGRWILDDNAPSSTTTRAHDGYGQCSYLGRFITESSDRVPSGYWRMHCGTGWEWLEVSFQEISTPSNPDAPENAFTAPAGSTAEPAGELEISGACSSQWALDGTYLLVGATPSGSPIWKGDDFDRWIYYDADCSEDGRHSGRWILNGDEPRRDADWNLDRDGACAALAYFVSENSSSPPSSGTWNMLCGGDDYVNRTVTIWKNINTLTYLNAIDPAALKTSSFTFPDFLSLSGACSKHGDLNSLLFQRIGATAAGIPYYRAFGSYSFYWIYYDPHCDGSIGTQGRWVIDGSWPNATATSDLDGDGACNYYARLTTSYISSVPTGTWRMACSDDGFSDVKLSIEEASPPAAITWNGICLEGNTWHDIGGNFYKEFTGGTLNRVGTYKGNPYFKFGDMNIWLVYGVECDGCSIKGNGWILTEKKPFNDWSTYAGIFTGSVAHFATDDSFWPPAAAVWRLRCGSAGVHSIYITFEAATPAPDTAPDMSSARLAARQHLPWSLPLLVLAFLLGHNAQKS